MSEINKSDTTLGAGTDSDPIRYGIIKKDDPERQTKLEAQREQFSKDAGEGKIICLTELFASHGL